MLVNFVLPLPQFGQAEPRSAGVNLHGSVLHKTAANILVKKKVQFLFLSD
jgi:hypothetical protein